MRVPLDIAAIVSTVLEAMFYGFSALMFIGTMWALSHRHMRENIQRGMVAVSWMLFLFSSAHMVIDIIRLAHALISKQATASPAAPDEYFANVTEWSFVSKTILYTLQTLLGDAVVIYRCYVVWRSLQIVTFLLFLWCSVAVTGVGSIYALTQATGTDKENIFAGITGPWIITFFVATLITNIFSTTLLAYRIWKISRKVSSLSPQTSVIWPVLRIVLDAGILYSIILLIALMCFVTKNGAHYAVLDMIMPIIAITFYMVIVRITIAMAAHSSGTSSLGFVRRLNISRSSQNDESNQSEQEPYSSPEGKKPPEEEIPRADPLNVV